jgi:hypothetical protein
MLVYFLAACRAFGLSKAIQMFLVRLLVEAAWHHGPAQARLRASQSLRRRPRLPGATPQVVSASRCDRDTALEGIRDVVFGLCQPAQDTVDLRGEALSLLL